ncbi:class I SAM-dependent methyltransferase [Microbacterium sp. NPDC055903]
MRACGSSAPDAAGASSADADTGLLFEQGDYSQDGVVCALVIHHLTDRPRVLAEVRRILRPGGWFMLSSTHPTANWGYFGGSYFDERWVIRSFGEATMEYQLMTIGARRVITDRFRATKCCRRSLLGPRNDAVDLSHSLTTTSVRRDTCVRSHRTPKPSLTHRHDRHRPRSDLGRSERPARPGPRTHRA